MRIPTAAGLALIAACATPALPGFSARLTCPLTGYPAAIAIHGCAQCSACNLALTEQRKAHYARG